MSLFTAEHRTILALGLLSGLLLAGCHQMSPNNMNLDPDAISGVASRNSAGQSTALKVATVEPEKELAAIAKLEQKGRGAEAAYGYERLIAEEKATATVYQRFAILLDRQGKFDQSAKYFLAAMKAEPENTDILCDYGYSRFVQGDLATAEKSLRQALELEPQMARAHNNLALVLARQERAQEAREHFRQAGATTEQANRNLEVAVAAHAGPNSGADDKGTGVADITDEAGESEQASTGAVETP